VASGRAKIADGEDGSPEMTVYSTTEGSERVLARSRLGKL